MAAPDDPGFWKEAANYLWISLLAVGKWAWSKQEKRLDDMEKKLEAKADASELQTQRGNISKLFDAQTEIREDMHKGFSEIKDTLHKSHVEILNILTRK